MFDYVVGKVLGYGLMLNGLALSGVAVTVHLSNTLHVLFVTPFGLLVAFFGYKIATVGKSDSFVDTAETVGNSDSTRKVAK